MTFGKGVQWEIQIHPRQQQMMYVLRSTSFFISEHKFFTKFFLGPRIRWSYIHSGFYSFLRSTLFYLEFDQVSSNMHVWKKLSMNWL